MKQGTLLTGLRRESGLTLRQLETMTGINRGVAHRAIVDPANANRGDVRKLRRAMADAARRRRSSDPEFLREIQERAVPFLRERERPGRRP